MSWPVGHRLFLHHTPSGPEERVHAALAELHGLPVMPAQLPLAQETRPRAPNRLAALFENDQLGADMGRMQMADDRENPCFVCLEFDDLRLPHFDQGLNAVGFNG